MWSRLDISINSNSADAQEIIESCFERVFLFEQKFSRFIPDNWLDKLNSKKRIALDNEAKSLIELSKKISKISQGHFDITVRPFLENRWYGIKKERFDENKFWYQNVEITEDEIILHNDVSIDFWSLGKGYMIDIVYKTLKKTYDSFIVDFWGDIKVAWKHTIYLEDPLQIGKYIGNYVLEDASIAASWRQKRRFWDSNHLISPLNPDWNEEIIGAFIKHKLATFADAFSTAVMVSPRDIALKILQETPDLEGCIIEKNGTIHQSKKLEIIWNNQQ